MAGFVLFASGVVLAQQVFVPVSVEELCGMSDVIVDGSVAAVARARPNRDGKLETPVEITIAAVLKGPASLKKLTLIEPGGKESEKSGAREEVYFGQIIPHAGERYVLFLVRDPTLESGDPGAYRTLGGLHGHYRVADGRIVVHPAMPRILRTGFSGAPVEMLLNAVRRQLNQN